SKQNSSRDSLTGGVSGATGVKFTQPTVYNGMVYVGTGGGTGTGGHILGTVVGYGLLAAPSAPTSPTAPVVLANKNVHLTWTRVTTTETETQVERSTDGTTWMTLAYLPNGASSYDDTTASAGTQYFYRVTAWSGPSFAHSSAITVTFPNFVR